MRNKNDEINDTMAGVIKTRSQRDHCVMIIEILGRPFIMTEPDKIDIKNDLVYMTGSFDFERNIDRKNEIVYIEVDKFEIDRYSFFPEDFTFFCTNDRFVLRIKE